MLHRTSHGLLPGALALVVALGACSEDRTVAPSGAPPDGTVQSHPDDGPLPGQPAGFRLTGGGRIDQRDHLGFEKNTPESRDFATFGFQARPTGSNTTEGSGNITWVEHNPQAVGGGFTFHGRVSFFTTPTDETALDADCGRFGGTGRARTRDGQTFEGLSFTVEHACDKGEPGVGRDHIKINIAAGAYVRHGLLSGGNIQKHKLTGQGS